MTKNIYKIICLIFFLFLFLAVTPRTPAVVNDFYTADNTLEKTLENGMTVVIHEMYKIPLVTINIIVKTGSATEGNYAGSGISHLVEHMLFYCGDKTNISYNEKIKLLGGHINGYTSYDYTGYIVTIPSENTVEALKILKDLISYPSFDALDLKKEKEVILDEIRRNKDDPARSALDLAWSLTFREHPYKHPIIGYEDLFARLDKKDIDDYWQARYSPHSMVLAVSGDVKKDMLFKELKEIFGPLKRNFVATLANINEPLQLSRRSRTEYRPISLAHVILSYRSAGINDASLYPLDVLAIDLGVGEDSILTKELRERRKLVYYISCQNYTLRDSGLFFVYLITDFSKVNDAVDAVLEELEKIKNDGISEADLNKSKRSARMGLTSALETVGGRARDISISEAISNNYGFSQFYLGGILGVTSEEVKSAAKTYLKAEYLNTVLILPEKSEEAIITSGSPQKPSRKIIREALPNGMRLLICEDRTTPMCSISAIFLGGVRAENSKNNGLTYLASRLLLDGTIKRTESNIKSEIESGGGHIQSISGNNSFGISLDLLSDDWRKGLEIASDIIMNSVFNEENIIKEKTLALAAIKSRDDDILSSGLLLFKQNFYKDHPYRFDALGTADTIQNITRDDIVSYCKSLCVPGNMIFAVTGDINADEILMEIKKVFVAFKATEPKLPSPPASKIPKDEKEIFHHMKREQSLIMVGFPSVKLTDEDRYVFEIIGSIMSGTDGRMFNNIRGKLGMAYALGSSFMPGLEPGCHVFYALTKAQNIEIVKSAILKEIKELKSKLVSTEELEAAKKALITSYMQGLQKSGEFGLKISLDELYGLGYRNHETYNTEINNVTASHVKRVANQYFNTDNCLIVIIQGEG